MTNLVIFGFRHDLFEKVAQKEEKDPNVRSFSELFTYTLQLSTENTGLVISDSANIAIIFQREEKAQPLTAAREWYQ